MLGVMAAVAMMATAGWAAGETGKDGKDAPEKSGTKVFTAGDGSVTITVNTDANTPAKKPDGMKIEIREAGKETKEPGQKADQPGMHVKTIQVRPGVEVSGEATKEALTAARSIMEAQAANGGWAGIHVTPVPAAVAAQLDLKGRGAMVANIAKGSPAEKAGLQRYDIVVLVKGQDGKDVEGLVAGIRAHKPGEQVYLTVVRKGLERQVELTLASPPAPGSKVEYLYEQDADESWQDQFQMHKGLIRKGPQGWTMVMPEGGGAPGPVAIPLPPNLLKAMPNPGYGEFYIARGGMGDTKKSFKVVKKIDGTTIEVEGAADGGGIVVRRTGPGDQKTEAKFANTDELRQKDPEAFELYKSVTTTKAPQGAGGGSDAFYLRPTIVVDGKAVSKEAAEKARQVEVELEKWLKEWGEKAKHEGLEAREHIARAIEPGRHYDFQVAANGEIAVAIHEDGNTARLTFKNVAEMAEKNPRACEAYEKLVKGGK
jgi:hypothetical protein